MGCSLCAVALFAHAAWQRGGGLCCLAADWGEVETVQGAAKRFGMSAAVLKWIAVVTMVIDHFAAAVYLQMAQGYHYEV